MCYRVPFPRATYVDDVGVIRDDYGCNVRVPRRGGSRTIVKNHAGVSCIRGYQAYPERKEQDECEGQTILNGGQHGGTCRQHGWVRRLWVRTMAQMGRHVALNDRLSVSSAIVQRYMDPILDAALSQHPQTQSAAVDILSFTIKQGLAHPLQSFPVIVALETSPNTTLSARASALHSVLNSKHASLLNSRYIVSARASFSYQAKLVHARGGSGAVEGARGGTALLHRWFALVREKRGPKLEFLKALVRVFDVGTSLVAVQDDIDFARYMAENFAAFDYKTQEEVLLVVKSLTNVLSTAGMQCIEALSPGYLLAQLQAPIVQQPLRTQADGTEAPVPDVTTADPAEQGSTSP